MAENKFTDTGQRDAVERADDKGHIATDSSIRVTLKKSNPTSPMWNI
jgi:hypothetical protein